VLQTLPLQHAEGLRAHAVGRRTARLASGLASLVIVGCAFLIAAWLGGTPPFEGDTSDPYSEQRVLRALPFDVPLPYDMSLVVAGRGDELPYHAQWTSQAQAGELIAQYEQHLAASPKWRELVADRRDDEAAITLARGSSDGILTHFAKLTISRDATQTVVTFDFTPIPSSLAPE
jgi:hypothetical protein